MYVYSFEYCVDTEAASWNECLAVLCTRISVKGIQRQHENQKTPKSTTDSEYLKGGGNIKHASMNHGHFDVTGITAPVYQPLYINHYN